MNHLDGETSPYLQQHASNPVEWYPWGAAAFERASREDKPVFVSIGYSSCHWCHVMAHESFEDLATAELLNDSFISIKVDREERPDIDSIYMAATLAYTGSGGWPMSVFCTPDARPFFAGTYFPPSPRHGMPSFQDLLRALSNAWNDQRDEVESQADALRDAIEREYKALDESKHDMQRSRPKVSENTSRDGVANDAAKARSNRTLQFNQALDQVVFELSKGFDSDWGGFGSPPKFPRPALIELCLRHHLVTGSERSRQMALTTLDAMAAGGIYDHLQGGFCRYSTDRYWLVPHFEKMLTDQALLARTYLHAWQVTQNQNYLQVLDETLTYVIGCLGSKEGGIFSSQDADAGGVEGSHATFTLAEIKAGLEAAQRLDLLEPLTKWYGITRSGNWEGTNILRRPIGAPLQRPQEIEEASLILQQIRMSRTQPALDNKVLTEWNAMIAAVLAEAASATGNATWGEKAIEIAQFLFKELTRPQDGRWLRSWKDTQARHLGLASDYGWLTECCTRLAEFTGLTVWRQRGCEVADAMLDNFWDPAHGALFTTGNDSEALIVRPKEFIDGATPSANSIGALALVRLGALSGNEKYRDAGERIVELALASLEQSPSGFGDLLCALGVLEFGTEVVIPGTNLELVQKVQAQWLPTNVLVWGERDNSLLWKGRKEGFGYVCRGHHCELATNDSDTLLAQLTT